MAEGDGGVIDNAGGDQGGNRPQWMSSLPDAHKANERFAQFKEPTQVWDKFDQLLKAEGQMVRIPDEKATDAEKAEFYKRIGRPETADKYTITKPEGLPEGIPYSTDLEPLFKAKAHELNLTDAQAKAIYGWYYDLAKQGYGKTQAEEAAAKEAAVNALKDEWKGDTFKENVEVATRAFKKFFGDDDKATKFIETEKIGNVPIGDHPMFLKIFASIGKQISDDSMNAGRSGGGEGSLSDEEKAKRRFPKTYK